MLLIIILKDTRYTDIKQGNHKAVISFNNSQGILEKHPMTFELKDQLAYQVIFTYISGQFKTKVVSFNLRFVYYKYYCTTMCVLSGVGSELFNGYNTMVTYK